MAGIGKPLCWRNGHSNFDKSWSMYRIQFVCRESKVFSKSNPSESRNLLLKLLRAPQKLVNNRRILASCGSEKPYILGFGHTNFDKSWSMYVIQFVCRESKVFSKFMEPESRNLLLKSLPEIQKLVNNRRILASCDSKKPYVGSIDPMILVKFGQCIEYSQFIANPHFFQNRSLENREICS